jgi:hypothetical protein
MLEEQMSVGIEILSGRAMLLFQGVGASDIHKSARRNSWMKQVTLLNSSINTRHQRWKQNVEFFVWLSCETVVRLWQTISGERQPSSEKVA